MNKNDPLIDLDDKQQKIGEQTRKQFRLNHILLFFTFVFLVFFGLFSQEGDRIASSIFTNSASDQWNNKESGKISGSKWIVLTTVQYPTEDIKYLASQPGWDVVVVADMKTPSDWNLPGVHFLSLEKQRHHFGEFSGMLPFHSYTRKNLGYLYAIMNGAEWIYDTDDDNKPYGLGLNQFDYLGPISGLRYFPRLQNISERLFNPYRFYGYKNMWPRGFPLEYLERHTNGRDRMISCREMAIPAVQQGVVSSDPDVDAIYRLLYARKESGLNVTFNNIAPSIILEKGTYSPWNSQNTLFHYKAFFILYLPSSVAFRVTDIWRSYFGQKLLHLIGENVGFYPANAVQIRNAHNYLDDFQQETDVYQRSGKIVNFLDQWTCSHGQIVDCVKELATEFVKHQFFKQSDKDLIEVWLEQLAHLGYKFPPLSNGVVRNQSEAGNRFGNCRNANFDLSAMEYNGGESKESKWASETINGFGEVLNWCKEVSNDTNTLLPSPNQFLSNYQNIQGLQNKRNTALVFISNQDWRPAIVGLLQRMYSPFFLTTIFCGTWTDPPNVPGTLPPIRPLNFLNITQDEMRNGHGYQYCVSKVNELRLQNVKGYYFVADDVTFSLWNDLPMDEFVNPYEIDNGTFWWRPQNIRNSYDLFEVKYKNHSKIGKSWREHQAAQAMLYPRTNITQRYLNYPRKSLADFVYIPSKLMEISGNLMEVMAEADVFSEVSFGLVQDGINYNRGKPFEFKYVSSWGSRRLYDQDLMGTHALKLGSMHTPERKEDKKQFCLKVIGAFSRKIYDQVDLTPISQRQPVRIGPARSPPAAIPPQNQAAVQVPPTIPVQNGPQAPLLPTRLPVQSAPVVPVQQIVTEPVVGLTSSTVQAAPIPTEAAVSQIPPIQAGLPVQPAPVTPVQVGQQFARQVSQENISQVHKTAGNQPAEENVIQTRPGLRRRPAGRRRRPVKVVYDDYYD